ncbi:tRNA lysidine(34) synthetase TilS [Limnohabitans sp. 2KL-51]|jgi:tRNA(Ile)-lysidine synthase|uniref:tRNA lysidine(34) synthetase TilS n=1 Tax=Limnohabitans sp. 2KL-51 TaxID=1977911 RepID=UPI000D35587C|nr:tRNA lysidine(34) synthetase TilS [Limnohabitans sp. 2KL-51]PUE46604.1 tRNA lysidine(34) synthetase TilS [Limnohabitans sp. 2KL-51]
MALTPLLPIEQALADFSPGLPFAVAFSGGADSTALLWACARRWPGQVRAVHIHHGLQLAADAFEAHCRALCQQLNVPLTVRKVQAGHAQGQSPEDAARKARYAALAEAVQSEWPEVHGIALAQHADDQVETLLIALSRGAGLPGLASMPSHWQRQGLDWYRPFLAVPGAALRAWIQSQGHSWVEDPSNTDESFTRNRIRARVLPALAEALPAFRETFARSAAHAAQAQEILNEVAAQDMAHIGAPPRIEALQRLSRARQALVLRHWLRLQHATTPSAAQLNELLDQLTACTTRGHRIHLKVGVGFVQREGQHLSWQTA